jgi:hypothetical protein
MSDDNKEKLLADLRKMDFSRSKPTAIGDEHGSRDRYGNLLLDPKIVRRVFPGAVLDYTKIDPAALSDNFQDIEKRMIREFIKAHPEMGPMELQKALLEAKGYEVSYQVIRTQREKD